MSINPYPIYVINLKRTPERKLHIQRQLDALNLSYSFVDAVDKYDLSSPAYRAEIAGLLGIDEVIINRRGTLLPRICHHFACSLSHVKVYNLMIERNERAACILEDDAVLSPDFPAILRAAQKAPWDILMLSSQSRTIRHIPAMNLDIQINLKTFPNVNCSLFPRLRKIKWFRRLLPLTPTSQSQLDWTFIPKLEWCLLMLLSHSRTSNTLFKYFINAYKLLRKFYNPAHHRLYKGKRGYGCTYVACKIGGLPVRSSQQTLYEDYDMAIPAEVPTSSMAYMLTLSMANKCKAVVNSEFIPLDSIPWYLHNRDGVRLRIVTPSCVSASSVYLKTPARG